MACERWRQHYNRADMTHMLIFGLGYTASHLAQRLMARGWSVSATTRDGRGGTIRFDDQAAVLAALRGASHVLSSVPPGENGSDPVLADYGDAIAVCGARWVGYLSSTGVYGDTGGAWVDEGAPLKGRRPGRNAADLAWQDLRGDVRVLRLPGIYGPGRSAIDRVRAGQAYRVNVPDQIFSRVHVDDIAGAVIASFASDAVGPFNIADDAPASQNAVVEEAARIVGAPPPAFVTIDSLSLMARSFYAENRRVANGRARRLLGWVPGYPDFRAGLARCLAAEGGNGVPERR
jgi:nucleoside-diphosphate-sugar epimerase